MISNEQQNDDSISSMLPINQITTAHKQYSAIRDYTNSTNFGQVKKMAQSHVRIREKHNIYTV